MSRTKSSSCIAAIAVLAAANGAFAQISSINSASYSPRQFNDIPAATLTVVSNYPSLISFQEQNVSKPTGFANRDSWHFSSDSGATSFLFFNQDAFTITMTVTLTGDPISPRKEAGFVFNNPLNDGGEFIVNTDGHEVVAFGGFLPFYAFPRTFQSGDSVTMGLTVFQDSNGKNAIIYFANCQVSPPLEFSNLEHGVIDGTTIGGYLQIVNAPTNANNNGIATFQNIRIGPSDQDFDGVPDAIDQCPGTPPCSIVTASGCSLEQLAPCDGPWRNHGAYVSTVAHVVNELVREGRLSEHEGAAIVSQAAQSDCGKKTHPGHDDPPTRPSRGLIEKTPGSLEEGTAAK